MRMRTWGIYNVPQSQWWKRCCGWYTNTQAKQWEETTLKKCVWRAGHWGMPKWKYERTLVLTCENGCAFVSSFVYGSEVSFLSRLSGLISTWKGYFCKKKKRRTYSRWGDSGDCGAWVSRHPKWRLYGRLLWPVGELLNIPSHGTFSLLIKMEMRWSRPTWGGKVMTRVDLFFFFLFIFQIHSFGRGRNGCWPCVRNQSLHTPARERGGGKEKKERHKCALWKETDWINSWCKGEAKANLFTRSLKYKLQEARTFWWTSNSLPSTIIFRSVNSFALRCWFSSFNISVEEEKETDSATCGVRNSFFTH